MIAVLFATLWMLSLILFFASARSAPVGFEDEAGFHVVEECYEHNTMLVAPARVR